MATGCSDGSAWCEISWRLQREMMIESQRHCYTWNHECERQRFMVAGFEDERNGAELNLRGLAKIYIWRL